MSMPDMSAESSKFLDSGYREISEDLYAINECVVQEPMIEEPENVNLDWLDLETEFHYQQVAYLFDDDKTLLFDTLTPMSEEMILRHLDDILGENGLDYLVISHPEANHAGNTGAILDAYPEAELVAPARGVHHELFGLHDSDTVVEDGDRIDLGDHTVEFVTPYFHDHTMSTWMSETTTGTLFTVDFVGADHMDGECLHFVDEMKYDLTESQLERFNGMAFVWFRVADPEQINAAIDAVISEYTPEVIAPAHGQVIRENPTKYLEKMKSVIQTISEHPDHHVNTHLAQYANKFNMEDIRL
jgi:flavorubredoxin